MDSQFDAAACAVGSVGHAHTEDSVGASGGQKDFRKFFDTVDHDFLLSTLDRIGVNRTPLEQYVIERFWEAPSRP